MEKQNSRKKRWSIKKIMLIVCAVLGGIIIIGTISNHILNSDIEKATECIATGNFGQAQKILDGQISANGTVQKLYVVYADFYLAQNDYLSAIDILERGLNRCSSKDEIQTKLNNIQTTYSDEIAKLKAKKKEEEREVAQAVAKEESRKQAEIDKKKRSEKEYKASCQTMAYSDLARNPDKYKGTALKFTGQIVQVHEPTFGNTVTLRINVTKTNYDLYTDTIYATVSIPDGSNRLLEKDIVTIYGDCDGMYSYTSVLHAKVSLPKIDIRYYDLQK